MKRLLIVLSFFFSCTNHNQTVEENYNRGNIKDDLKEYEGAIKDYTKAIELDPNNAVG